MVSSDSLSKPLPLVYRGVESERRVQRRQCEQGQRICGVGGLGLRGDLVGGVVAQLLGGEPFVALDGLGAERVPGTAGSFLEQAQQRQVFVGDQYPGRGGGVVVGVQQECGDRVEADAADRRR